MTAAGPTRVAQRRRIFVRGTVQGVGFRPFVYTLATELGLAGHVTNTGAGVLVEIEGGPAAVAAFCRRIDTEAPALASVESITHEELAIGGDTGFTIVASVPPEPGAAHRTRIPPDVATCARCLAELEDPADRRHLHPFITCTDCGPRFTIVTALPYDRAHTTMADFPMCPDCAREYTDPGDRRFHAQPIACHACGPRLSLVDADGAPIGFGTLDEARRMLAQGAILAVKGIGGYHLACDAGDEDAVLRLRERKGRGDKPFALLARTLAEIEPHAAITDAERELLTGAARPIVLLRRRPAARATLPEAIAPRCPDLGFMLPYTPLHHLLLGLLDDRAGPRLLVLTSGNAAGEPIVTDDDNALTRLATLADGWLTHDRPIRVPLDDSVVRMVDGEPLFVRRSRGWAPLSIRLPVEVPATLAVGGDLKNTFALAEGREAWLSGHVGDMDDLATQDAFEHTIEHLGAITGVRPEVLVADRHPGYRSTGWARRAAAQRPVRLVQHHHAHIAAAMAEHELDGAAPVLGVAFDGTGYGDDGAVWGGEFLLADYADFQRVAHLRYVPLAGGDAAVARPYRMALAHLYAAGIEWSEDLPCVRAGSDEERRVLARQLERDLNCVPTSSMGRLFDAFASLIGVCHLAGYEAQAAIELEGAAVRRPGSVHGYTFALLPGDGEADPLIADPGPVFAAAIADLRAGRDPELLAARFHRAVVDLVVAVAEHTRERYGPTPVALTGGVFANAIMSSACGRALCERGFTVLRHRLVPPNDGGLALGQVLVGAARRAPTEPSRR
ncbi:carbamoyltransferase HypF [Embleya sp. NPDC020630]|uniref:carbamoyltransferase HypF n=1 Tax=Embleya sp. NPDC020630 TaxID=3363979 RepID=UPI0037A90201